MELIPGTRIQEIIAACREVGLASMSLPTRSEIAAMGEELLKLRASGPCPPDDLESSVEEDLDRIHFRDVELPLGWGCP